LLRLPICSTWDTVCSSISTRNPFSTSFSMKSCTPIFMAFTAVSMVPYAVIRITRAVGSEASSFSAISRPVMPGILKSEMTRSYRPCSYISSASGPLLAALRRWPRRDRLVVIRSRMSGSSSTTRISAMHAPPRVDADLEPGGFGRLAGHRDRAAMQGHDALHDRQAQPGPLLLGSEEGVEDFVHDVLGNAFAVVDDGYP